MQRGGTRFGYNDPEITLRNMHHIHTIFMVEIIYEGL
jgi:hypothetical protein